MKTLIAVTLVLLAAVVQAAETLPLYPDGIPNSIAAPDEESVRDPKVEIGNITRSRGERGDQIENSSEIGIGNRHTRAGGYPSV